MSESRPYRPVVGGHDLTSGRAFPVIDPATEEIFAHCDFADTALVEHAIAAAMEASPVWIAAGLSPRAAALQECGMLVEKNVEEWAHLLTREQGKPLAKARDEIMLAAAWFRWTAELTLLDEVLPSDGVARVRLRRHPFGVVAAITPWNYPIILAVCKIAPALLAGNTVILKPSEYTPLTSVLLVRALQAALPPGVLNVLPGDMQVSRALAEHPMVRKVSFTGSIPAGQAIMAAASTGVKSVTLELGGNDPAIVFPGCDVGAVAPRILEHAFANSGQFCAAIKRLYVHTSLERPLLDRLTALAEDLRVGAGIDRATQLGPLTHGRQLARVSWLVEEARRRGATILTGGRRVGTRGFFYAPTIVSKLRDEDPLVQEEQFGPVLPVLAFDDADELLPRVNSTVFGLGASIWCPDLSFAENYADRIVAGTVWINQHAALSAHIPFGGTKLSGRGYEYGRWGLEEYVELRVRNSRTLQAGLTDGASAEMQLISPTQKV